MSISRRQLLLGSSVLLAPAAAGATPPAIAPRAPVPGTFRTTALVMADLGHARQDKPENIARRFEIYRSLGFGMLRTGLGWRALEKSEGRWATVSSPEKRYYALAAQYGFRLKYQFGCISAVPAWFQDKYPDSRVLNQRNDSADGYLSPWYPALREILAEKTERVVQAAQEAGALSLVDVNVVDLGPAGEPLYPAAWIVKKGYTPKTSLFWYFDQHAQADFGRQMQVTYRGDLTQANRKWGTSFRSWADVQPPVPGTIRGPIWYDTLNWYFDAKRRMISDQIAVCKSLMAKYSPSRPIASMIMMPGERPTREDFDLTASNGIGDYLVKIAVDNNFIVDEAIHTGCLLHFG